MGDLILDLNMKRAALNSKPSVGLCGYQWPSNRASETLNDFENIVKLCKSRMHDRNLGRG